MPLDRIVQLDINGGEPSSSKNYLNIIKNLPPNIKSIRLNTNCSSVITELGELSDKGIKVTVTVSFDGTRSVHEYVRWPIKWEKYYQNLLEYKAMNLSELNLWTTVNALNVCDLDNMFSFAEEHNINHSYAFLDFPDELNIKYENKFTLKAKHLLKHKKSLPIIEKCAVESNNQKELDIFLEKQNKIRSINYTFEP